MVLAVDESVGPDDLSVDDGVFLVRLAREAVEKYLKEGKVFRPPQNTPAKLMLKGMSFVTIRKLIFDKYELRGCIGYLHPIEPLALNVVNAAIAAAVEDPRFNPMSEVELNSVIFEVSVLSTPKTLVSKGWDLINEVKVGVDGLVIEYGVNKGLLLPEVPIEYCWDGETFLSETCLKAGLPPDCWLHPRVKVQKFNAAVFKELRPHGDVVMVDLLSEYRRNCGHIANPQQ
ncbi:MAG: TIGR00296 family protein [Sulfolobales archaeon]|nr:TIGR00296 family protein [Sulfolobales archaeon]